MLLMRPRGPLMRAWGSRAEPADAHDARPLGGIMGHPRPSHFSCLNPGRERSAALAFGLILLRRRPEASKAIPGTTRVKRSANARSLGTSRCPILRGCAHGRAAHAEARGEQFLSMLRPLNSLKIFKR